MGRTSFLFSKVCLRPESAAFLDRICDLMKNCGQIAKKINNKNL
jgi:hypothetical protein